MSTPERPRPSSAPPDAPNQELKHKEAKKGLHMAQQDHHGKGSADNYAAQGGKGSARPISHDVIRGLLSSRALSKSGRIVLSGLSDLQEVKPAKLPHTWWNNVVPGKVFTQMLDQDYLTDGAVPPVKIPDADKTYALSGMQFLLTDPTAAAPGIVRDTAVHDQSYLTSATATTEIANNNPLGPDSSKQSNDLSEGYGFEVTRYLNALNFPVATANNAAHGDVPCGPNHTGHVGFRNKNYVSGPNVHVSRVCVNLNIRTEMIIAELGSTTMNPANMLQNIGGIGSGTLDFRVVVIQNTNSYKVKYGSEPNLWKDYLRHPMGNPMEGLHPGHTNAATTTKPAFTENITGWPVANITSTVSADNAYQMNVPNQNTSAYQLAAASSGACPYVAPKLHDVMNGSINTEAYRVLHEEKFTLGVNNAFFPNSTLPTERTLNLDFPVYGLVDIAEDPHQSNLTTAVETAASFARTHNRRSWGWDARNIYHNAPRILIFCSVAGGRVGVRKMHFTLTGSLPAMTPSNASVVKTNNLWTANTSGYTVYRDQPHPNIAGIPAPVE